MIQSILSKKGEIRGTVYVTLGTNDARVVDKQDFKISTRGDASKAYAKYFDSIITGKNQNTAGTSRAQRISELVKKIDESVQKSLETQRISWKRQNEVSQTIIGDLQTEYRASKAGGFINSSEQGEYDKLALLLAKKVNNKGSARIRGLDKHYLRALKVFSPSISTKWRDHRVK